MKKKQSSIKVFVLIFILIFALLLYPEPESNLPASLWLAQGRQAGKGKLNKQTSLLLMDN
jgi:hypothetical protein